MTHRKAVMSRFFSILNVPDLCQVADMHARRDRKFRRHCPFHFSGKENMFGTAPVPKVFSAIRYIALA